MDKEKKINFLKKYIPNKIEISDLIKLGKEEEANEIKAQQRNIESGIAGLSNNYERIVITKKYILNESFDKIAEEINYSNSQTRRFHESGINNLIL